MKKKKRMKSEKMRVDMRRPFGEKSSFRSKLFQY
jgi:hypothetical protein